MVKETVKVEFIPLACVWAYCVPGQEVLSWSLGASHPQVKAPVLPSLSIGKLGPQEGAFGHLANWPFEANKAFEKLSFQVGLGSDLAWFYYCFCWFKTFEFLGNPWAMLLLSLLGGKKRTIYTLGLCVKL